MHESLQDQSQGGLHVVGDYDDHSGLHPVRTYERGTQSSPLVTTLRSRAPLESESTALETGSTVAPTRSKKSGKRLWKSIITAAALVAIVVGFGAGVGVGLSKKSTHDSTRDASVTSASITGALATNATATITSATSTSATKTSDTSTSATRTSDTSTSAIGTSAAYTPITQASSESTAVEDISTMHTSSTHTSAKSTSVTDPSATEYPVTSGFLGVAAYNCPSINNTILSSGSSKFQVACNIRWDMDAPALSGNGVVNYIGSNTTVAYSLQQCIDFCVSYNSVLPTPADPKVDGSGCLGVVYKANLTYVFYDYHDTRNCNLVDRIGIRRHGQDSTESAMLISTT